jgi:hypothetical protein
MLERFDFDRLASVSPGQAGNAAYAALDQLQKFRPEEQVAAAAVLFLLLTRKFETHPGNVLQVGSNIISRAMETTPELRGVLGYLKHEL